jgi:hypothetical protein
MMISELKMNVKRTTMMMTTIMIILKISSSLPTTTAALSVVVKIPLLQMLVQLIKEEIKAVLHRLKEVLFNQSSLRT